MIGWLAWLFGFRECVWCERFRRSCNWYDELGWNDGWACHECQWGLP